MRLIRHRSLMKSISARTTAKYKRQIKKKILPGYGKKGAGVIKNPKKAYITLFTIEQLLILEKLVNQKEKALQTMKTN